MQLILGYQQRPFPSHLRLQFNHQGSGSGSAPIFQEGRKLSRRATEEMGREGWKGPERKGKEVSVSVQFSFI